MIRRMIREEWRMHSEMYSGRSFAFFPVLVFGLSLGFSWLVLNYSTLGPGSLGAVLQGLGGFLGLMVGTVGFSSRDAMKNVLGPMNLLVYSSRTLPIPERKLLFDFIVKDLVYYTVLFLLPVALGPVVLTGTTLLKSTALMFAWFSLGIVASLAASRSAIRLPSAGLLNYRRVSRMKPLAAKSVLDLSRSTGGFLKIVFSLGLLTAFYWFAVIYFPVTRVLLNNPLLSFSVMLGTLNLSIYNWLNRFDSEESYAYLPVDRESILESKIQSSLAVSAVSVAAILLASYLVYPGNLLISTVSAVATTLYTILVASRMFGLSPNEKMFESVTFTKFIIANSLVVVPLLLASIFYTPALFIEYTAACVAVTAFSVYYLK